MEGNENKKNNMSWPIIVVMIVLLVVVGFCAYKLGEAGRKTIDDENLPKGGDTSVDLEMKASNPWTAVNSLADVQKNLGFTIQVPAKINELTSFDIVVSKDSKMVEVRYLDGEDESVFIRKAPISSLKKGDNFSGVYHVYANTKTVDNVTLSSNGNNVYLAEWEANNYHYSVYMVKGDSEDNFLKVVKEVK